MKPAIESSDSAPRAERDNPFTQASTQTIIDRVAAGIYQAKPAKVFSFAEIQAAHQLMESGKALGKIVVRL